MWTWRVRHVRCVPVSSSPVELLHEFWAAATSIHFIQAVQSAKFSRLRFGGCPSVCSGQENGAGGVFAKGFAEAVKPSLPDGTSVVEAALEGIRRHAESAGSSAHFFLTHSLAGGTGAFTFPDAYPPSGDW